MVPQRHSVTTEVKWLLLAGGDPLSLATDFHRTQRSFWQHEVDGWDRTVNLPIFKGKGTAQGSLSIHLLLTAPRAGALFLNF